MRRSADPELELVRRASPYGLPAAIMALVIGALVGGWGVGWSAALGVMVVTLNFIASGASMARAARVSLMALTAVGMIGWIVRLTVIVGLLFVLDRFGWFSPLTFGLAVAPATLLLIAFEMKLLAQGVAQQLVLPTERR